MKRISMIIAALSACVFASAANAGVQQKCSLTSVDAVTGKLHDYSLEIFWSTKTADPYHILVRDVCRSRSDFRQQ